MASFRAKKAEAAPLTLILLFAEPLAVTETGMIAQDAYFIDINQVVGQCRIPKYSTFYSKGQKGGGKWSYETKLQQFWCMKPELTIKVGDFRGKYKMLLKYTIWLL